ncbi:MAG: S1 RNA-binding domain-containing protein, partial [Halobacteriales archaeon]|nr:S1 RNA-binding domain-containing protein [Halobacteriales archaeon]
GGARSASDDGGDHRESSKPKREEIKEGHRYEGVVDGIAEYGAFVKFEDVSGLIHISNLSDGHVDRVEDVLQVGDRVTIEVARIDDKGRYSLKLINKLSGRGDGASTNGESASASHEGPDRDRE